MAEKMLSKAKTVCKNNGKNCLPTSLVKVLALLLLGLLVIAPSPSVTAEETVDPQLRTGEAVKESYGDAKIPQPDMATWYS